MGHDLPGPLADALALKLRERSELVEHEPPLGRVQIQGQIQNHKPHADLVQHLQRVGRIGHGAEASVQLGENDPVAALDRIPKLLALWPALERD